MIWQKLYKYFTFLALIQKIGRILYTIRYLEITIIFVKSKHVLSKKILENSDFVGLNLIVTFNKKNRMQLFHIFTNQILKYSKNDN